ncbi:MAG: hypothetical protein UT15_C0008G0005 [Berkelbacteria bacterium GW2011_GWA1_39_10]|uniref:Uncharacterized protein n=1 Tax=Berkelbacteria bacterium GW2011_GWA1_39_10 TaxID=1618332 RepID=A0A0G0NXT2_9BACT|nr:MAG: hypothetical protein UT15_C0008G0005 [Berkelbacteria bacterium GW2011_GWA1_39_10]
MNKKSCRRALLIFIIILLAVGMVAPFIWKLWR